MSDISNDLIAFVPCLRCKSASFFIKAFHGKRKNKISYKNCHYEIKVKIMENPIAYLGKEGYVFRDLLLVVGLQMAKIFTSTQDYNTYIHKPLLYLDLLSF